MKQPDISVFLFNEVCLPSASIKSTVNVFGWPDPDLDNLILKVDESLYFLTSGGVVISSSDMVYLTD